jgi:hypothetical protein
MDSPLPERARECVQWRSNEIPDRGFHNGRRGAVDGASAGWSRNDFSPVRQATLGYIELGPVRVSVSGVYEVFDAGDELAVNVVFGVYDDSFDPENTNANLLVSADAAVQITLQQGTDYLVVIQHQCRNRAGTYGIAMAGPGTITGQGVLASPEHTLGEFSGADPTADFGFGQTVYDINGPLQVPESGSYYFADVSAFKRVNMLLFVYRGSFDPEDPSQDVVGVVDDTGTIALESGADYYFVSVPWNDDEFGQWHYVVFPPGIAALNGYFSGAWFNLVTDGQGILMEVFPQLRLVFLAWFTFEQQDAATLERAADPGKTLALGGSSQRWFSAIGSYVQGASTVELTFQNTTGGAFNVKLPGQDQDQQYGSGTVHVDDCNNIVLEFDLPSGPVAGSNELGRVGIDPLTEERCLEAGSQPGVIE